MRTNRTVAERAFAAFLCLILVLGMFPVRTSAEETAPAYGSVVAATQGLTVTGSGTAEVAVSNGDLTLNWTPADPSIGRYQDAWWVGLNVYAPAGMTAEQLKDVKYGYAADNMNLSFWSNKDSADDAQSHYIGLWAITTDTYLKSNLVAYDWYISWDGTNVQHIHLQLDPSKIVLKDAQGNGVFPVYGAVVPATSGLTVTGSGTEEVSLTNGDLTLNWTPADPSIGRYQDAWWVGLNVYAPAGMTAEQLKNVKYGYAADNLNLNFWDNKDSADDAQSHYIGLWAITNETYLKKNLVAYDWYISWDGESVQHIHLQLDPSKIVLKDAQGNGVFPVYGAVVPATSGLTVTGSGTEEVALTNGDLTLTWTPANPSIGRHQDGWWVGLNVYAPAGMTAEQLKNVKYGYTADNLDRSFWANKDSADGAQNHYIGLWGITNQTLLQENKVTYDWYISWDGESVQHIQLKLDPAKVTLLEGANIGYGTVETILPKDAVVSGTDSAITVAVEKAELTWVEADDKLGREAGWWVGIKAIAPEGFSENAQYAYVNNGVIGAGKSFASYKDGANYIQLWIKVTDTALITDADRKLTMNYAFDWNGNGIYEQTVQFYVNADGDILLKNTAGQQVYPYFLGSVDAGNISTAVISDNETKTVTVDLGGHEIVWNNGWEVSVKATLNGQEKTVTAKWDSVDVTAADYSEEIDWNGDGLADQTVKLTGSIKLLKADQIVPEFEKASLGIDSEELNAKGAENAVANTDKAVGSAVYTIADNAYLTIDAQTGKVTVAEGKWEGLLSELDAKGSFEVEVSAKFVETATHKESASASYTLTINPKTDDSLTFAQALIESVYGDQQGKPYTCQQVPVSTKGTIKGITYQSSNTDVAKVDADGLVTYVAAGEATITATVTYQEGYTTTTASYDVKVVKAEQAPLTFTNSKLEITYNDNGNQYISDAVGGTTGNAVEYKILSGAEVADIAGSTLTIKASGTVTVQATMPGNDGYEDVIATYTLTVNKAQQKIALQDTEATRKNSEPEYPIVMVPETGWFSLKENYKFEIIEKDATVTGTTVDEVTGVITIDEGDYGKIVVKVTRLGDNCFLDWEGLTFTLNIQQIDADANNFKFEGAKHAGAEDSEWYCGEVTVTYEADGVKYQVSTDLEKTESWADSHILSADGIYDIKLSLKSTETHGGVHYAQPVPTVKIDQTAPVSTIEYTETVWGKVFETLTFGFYDAATTVKITATDGEGDVSGVSAVFYKLEGDSVFTETKGNTVVVTIPDQYIGKVEYYAVDKAGNREATITPVTTIVVDTTEAKWDVKYAYNKNVTEGEEVYTDENGVQYTRFDTTVTLTVEEKFFDLSLEALKLTEDGETAAAAPEIKGDDSRTEWLKGENDNWSIDLSLTSEGVHDMSMAYTNRSGLKSADYSQKIIIDRTVPVCEIAWGDAERVEDAETDTRYYKENAEKPATATITVTDANFNPANTVVTDHYKTVDGTEEDKVITVKWDQDAEDATKWTAVLTLKDEGTHNLTVDTTDWAGNVMETKTTDVVIIDYTAPVLEELKITKGTVKNAKDGRDYFNEPVTVTITVTEQNFSEEDLVNGIALKALDVTGADNSAGYTLGQWQHDGDKHTIELTFSADANFALDVSYADKANNAANDIKEILFTVDQVAPKVVGISYNKSLQDVVIEAITFSYYRAPVEVTLKVEDETAGIQQFDYSALLNANVSKVNAGIEKAVVTDVKQDGKVFYVTFRIPAEALTNKNQFNGYLQFTATDWATNVSTQETHKDKQSVVVDNISPKATVTYTEPVQTVDKVAYYDEEFTVSIAIDEANFFANDVNISVTRNGANYAVTPRWTHGAGDVHTGIFVLDQDGDYIVKVTYTDRSGNEMTEYTSHKMVLDTVMPTVEVTNVVANSANTDEVYTFDIIASDINIDPETFKPELTGVFRDADGKFITKTIDLGDMTVVKKDETYSFTVKNLEEDAIYTLTCTVSDLAKNTYEKMVLKDEKEYEEVQFSINRNGSTYMLDDDTAELVGNYYVQNVRSNVVLIEINPDVLEKHSVTLNGRDLADGDEYSVREEGGDGSWMKYTYSVNKDLMADESEYNLVVSSEDKAGNKAFSDVKGASIGFVVDRTAPVVTVTGMHNDGRYQVESQTVTLIPMDAGGALKALSVYLVDDDGNVLQQLIDLSGEDLYNALEENEDQITFEIAEGLYQNVRVVCTDMAVDEEGATNAYDETFTNISVSTSGFMIFWANKPLRYGVIFGTLGLAALILFLIFGKKKKA